MLTTTSSLVPSDLSIKNIFFKCSFTLYKTCFALCSHSFDLETSAGTISAASIWIPLLIRLLVISFWPFPLLAFSTALLYSFIFKT